LLVICVSASIKGHRMNSVTAEGVCMHCHYTVCFVCALDLVEWGKDPALTQGCMRPVYCQCSALHAAYRYVNKTINHLSYIVVKHVQSISFYVFIQLFK
jgi:hypothetical protein